MPLYQVEELRAWKRIYIVEAKTQRLAKRTAHRFGERVHDDDQRRVTVNKIVVSPDGEQADVMAGDDEEE